MSSLSEDPNDAAKKKGLDCVLPGDDELQIDIDDTASLQQYEAMVEVLKRNGVYVEETKRTVSQGGNTHIYARCHLRSKKNSLWARMFGAKAMDPMTRIALQACLGSDRKRELLSILRIAKNTGRPPTVFFEKPTVVSPTHRQISLENT